MWQTKLIQLDFRHTYLYDACARHAMLSTAAVWWITAIYWPDFRTFTYPPPIWYPQWGGSSPAIGFMFGAGKLEWLGCNLMKRPRDRLSHLGTIHQRDRHTHRQPHRHSKCSATALRRAAKIEVIHRLGLGLNYTQRRTFRERNGLGRRLS